MTRIRFALAAVLACGASISFAEPRAATHGPCSPVAAAGGTASANCIFRVARPPQGRLVVQQAWLTPTIGFMAPTVDGHRNEQAALTTVVRNLTESDVLINAARLEIIGSKALSMPGGMYGEGILQSTIGGTSPIRIEAGKTAKITFGSTVNLPGVIDVLERSIDMDEVLVIDELIPPRSNGNKYVEQIGQMMSTLYGKDAVLRASLFSGDYRLVAQFDIPLQEGATFFYKGEKLDPKSKRPVFKPMLAYDAFLGCYLKQREVWVVGFKIRETPRRCIDMIPDPNVPGGWRHAEAECRPASEPQAQSEQRSSEVRSRPVGNC